MRKIRCAIVDDEPLAIKLIENYIGRTVTHLTMKGIEETLPSDRFMRVSRSHIVALKHIRSVDRNMCIYIGDTMVKVTDMYKSPFESFLKDNLLEK